MRIKRNWNESGATTDTDNPTSIAWLSPSNAPAATMHTFLDSMPDFVQINFHWFIWIIKTLLQNVTCYVGFGSL